MKQNKKIICGIVFAMLLIPLFSDGAIFMSLYQRYRLVLAEREVQILCQGVCDTNDGITANNTGDMSYEEGNAIYLDNMHMTLYLGDQGTDNPIDNYLTFNFNEVLHNQRGDVIFRKYNKSTSNQYIQVCAKSNGKIIVSSYYDGEFNDALIFQVKMSDSKSKERFITFLNSNPKIKEDAEKDFKKHQENMHDKIQKLKEEEDSYDKLLKEEAEDVAPKFGLG